MQSSARSSGKVVDTGSGNVMHFRKFFLAETRQADVPSNDSAQSSGGNSPKGPGLSESMVWFLGAWAVNSLGLILTAGLMISFFVSAGVAWNDLIVLEFLSSHQLTLIAGGQFCFVTLALLAAWVRLRGNLGHRLGSRPLPWQHLLLLSCIVIPLSTVCGQIHLWAMRGWQVLVEMFPHYQSIDGLQSIGSIQTLAADSPLWALILVIAIAPALGEELIFRGVIGRGLTARLGMPAGIILTSALFAFAHLHPAQILAIFPMGLVLHFAYYTTRSFWAPLFIHFCNNAWAVVLLKQPGSVPQIDAELSFSALLMVSLSLAVFLAFLWQTRVNYLREDGSVWMPEKWSLELPVEASLRISFASLPVLLTIGGLVPFLGFIIAIAAKI